MTTNNNNNNEDKDQGNVFIKHLADKLNEVASADEVKDKDGKNDKNKN